MTVAQGAGAGLGAILAGVLTTTLQKYTNVTIDLPTATAIVTAMIAAVGFLAHAIDIYGLKGIINRLWTGKPKTPEAPPPAVLKPTK